MRVAFIINCRNKERWVRRSCLGALAQTYPCEIIFSDQRSTDRSWIEMQGAVMAGERGAEHAVRMLQCPVGGAYGMLAMNQHVDWIVDQTDAEWIFQASADDYSLPGRVAACMKAVEANPCDAVACHMHFDLPDGTRTGATGWPRHSGYIKAGEGLLNLAYGSTIAGYSREFLKRAGSAGRNTPDVFWGYLAALGKGFYVVAEPHHVHVTHADAQNTGFQGKLRAAEGDELARLNELNHLQLFALYKACADQANRMFPESVPWEDFGPVINTMLAQAGAWLEARYVLMDKGITPGAL